MHCWLRILWYSSQKYQKCFENRPKFLIYFIKKQWGSNVFDFGKHIPGKLSILTVSQISGIDKETCRRVVKKLISDGWVTYSRNEGIRYYPTEKNNQLMVKFNEAIEIPLFLNLATNIKKLT